MQDLGTLGGTSSYAQAINERGQVAGYSRVINPSFPDTHAFLWTAESGMQDLGSLGGSMGIRPTDINNQGEVVGQGFTASGYPDAFLWTATGGMQDLGTLGGLSSSASAINDAGQVIGYSESASGPSHAFLWTAGGGMQDLGTLGGTSSNAYAINDQGHIVGSSTTASGDNHATLWSLAPVANQPPTTDAGGPYSVNEGSTVLVTASGYDPERRPLSFTWDLDNDGAFETLGQSVTFSAASLDGPVSTTIAVQVTDSDGLTAIDQATVNVLNVAPTAVLNAPVAVDEGSEFQISLVAPSDPSSADTAAGFTYAFDCGAGYGGFTGNNSATCPPLDTYFEIVRGQIKDKDGGVSEYTTPVTIANVELVYRPIDLGTLGSGYSYAQAINDQGQVVGNSNTLSGESHAFLWTAAGGMQDLGTLGGSYSYAMAINNLGQVTGSSATASGEQHIFLWTATGGMQDLGTLGGSYSYTQAINDLGQVLGVFYTATWEQRVFLWTPAGGMQDLGTLGGSGSFAQAINNLGQVTGRSTTASGEPHAFLWTSAGGMQDLGTLGGEWSEPRAINNQGQVVGHSTTASGEQHTFLWTSAGGMQDLGTLGGGWSYARAINNSGQVLGTSTTASGEQHIFLWTATDGMQDLGAPGGTFGSANAINDLEQVVGYSYTVSSEQHAFLWTAARGWQDLGTLGSNYSYAQAINNLGQVLGGGNTVSGEHHAVLWVPTLVTNQPPAVDAGGPYNVNEGDSVVIAASGDDPNGDSLAYAWDLDNDGSFETLGQTVTVLATDLDGPSQHPIAVQVTDEGGLSAVDQTVVDVLNVAPTVNDISISPSPSLQANFANVSATFTDANPNDTPFTCTVNYGDGSGDLAGTVSDNTCTGPVHVYFDIGMYTVTVTVTDKDSDAGSMLVDHAVVYNFMGFFQPVDNLPILNTVNAGRAIPVKFSLGGYQGLTILATGYPTSTTVACGVTAEDAVEETTTAGSSSLSYDASTDQYTYVWKTDKAWAGTCQTLVIKLNDGTYHKANFKFK